MRTASTSSPARPDLGAAPADRLTQRWEPTPRNGCDAVERVRSKLEYTTLATAFVPEPFSLADLRRVYKAVWGSAPDLANFRRKVLSTNGFVIPVAETAEPTARGGRPAMLYRRGPATFLYPAMLRSDGVV
jgi:8-oxo-dGTP diphosphatase